MNQPKLSLVFPCWHASDHMQHVLEDLQAQTFKDFEAILVNDGDDSQVAAMEAIAAQDNRIRIVHREQNGGVAAARNAGTDAATTGWVTYPDPDDRFGPNYAKSLFEAVDGTGVEMACGGYTLLVVEDNKSIQKNARIDNNQVVMDFGEGYEFMLNPTLFPYAWNKLYKIELMREHALQQDTHFQISQDYAFNMIYFTFCKEVGMIRNCDYTYYQYKKSNGRRYHPQYFQYKLEIIKLREQFHRHIGLSERQIAEMREKEINMEAFEYIKRYCAFDSHLSLRQTATEIRTNLLSQPQVVDAILQSDPYDRITHILHRLIKLDNAYIIAFMTRLTSSVRHLNPKAYTKVKHFLRGNNKK